MRVLFTILILTVSMPAAAQTGMPAPPRAEVTGTVAWLHVPFDTRQHHLILEPDWTHHAMARATAGLYWTEHWKSEFSIAHSNEAHTWDTEAIQTGQDVTFRSIDSRVRYTEFALAQLYQFRRNEWVHPSLGAGVLVQRRSGESEYQPAIIHRPPTGVPVFVDPGGRRSLDTRTVVAPFVSASVKAYFTTRAFFRSDLQVAFRRDIESVTMHAGFGVDF